METMTFLKILIVAVPEAVMGILVGLVTCRSSLSKNNYKAFALKLALSVFGLIGLVYVSRKVFSGMVPHTLTSLLIFCATFKLVWEMNYRQSILAAGITVFIMGALDISTIPIYNMIVEKYYPDDYFAAGIVFTPFLRLLHILIFMVFTKYNLRDNEILTMEWETLTKYLKTGITVVITAMLWSILSMMNYSDLNYKIMFHKIDTIAVDTNIKLFFWIDMGYFVFILILAYYIFQYIQTKKLMGISPEQLLKAIKKKSTKKELAGYIKILQEDYKEEGS